MRGYEEEMFDEAACLQVDPFEGDFGTPEDRVLKDKIVTARKERPCQLCGHKITKGERIRILSAVFEGELMYYSWCELCCKAMVLSLIDEGEEYERRANLNKPIDRR